MKKNFIYALMSAIALTGSVGFSSCSSKDEIVDNPNYNPKTQEVLTQFVFNVSTGNTAITRMNSANTQASISENFRGISDANILVYKQGVGNDGKILSAAATAEKLFDLANIMGGGTIDPDGTGTIPKSHRIIELSLPTETNTLLFYGKAPKSATTGYDELQGKIGYHVEADITKNYFTLQPRLATDDRNEFFKTEDIISTILTRIIRTGINGTETYNNTASTITYGGSSFNQPLDWSDYVKTPGMSPINTSVSQVALEEILANAYTQFVTTLSGEARAGSGQSTARQIGDLWAVIKKVSEAEPTSLAEAVAKDIAAKIIVKFSKYFKEAGANCQWIATADVKTALLLALSDAEKTSLGSLDGVTKSIQLFPSLFNIPVGATRLKIDKTARTISYETSIGTNMNNPTDVNSIMYPAELCYFGNSPIRVSATGHIPGDYPDGTDNWIDDSKWTEDWKSDQHVLSSTRSVAMRSNINYGTALLKSTVGYSALTLYDNNHAIQKAKNSSLADTEEPDAEINIAAGSFTVTGFAIGGQNKEMGWNFLRKYETTEAASTAGTGHSEKFDAMIYDKNLPSNAIPASTSLSSDPNYTLVFDNYDSSIAANQKQSDVYVAVEFVNGTTKDFWGEHGLIPAGGTFYIVGKLDPTTASNLTARTDGYAMPPYDDTNRGINTTGGKRVFIQDYMTTVNFKLNANSLKHAYVTVPDLRSAQVSLGLSVDMKWETGLTFSNVVLGQ